MAVITVDRARVQRAREVENALASVRIEGLEPSDEAKAMFQRYVDGAVTSEELDRGFDMYFDRKYGPLRLPGNERS
jgi:Antitoxin VbhA